MIADRVAPDICVIADKDAVDKIMNNLIFNAIKYSDTRITVRVSRDDEFLILEEKSLSDTSKSIEDKMRECKDIITRDPKEGDGDLITRTQSFIRQKAGHDKSKFKEAAIEIALLQKSPASQVWFMGCGQLLIEELEV